LEEAVLIEDEEESDAETESLSEREGMLVA
jgi:hypothetical protein